MSVDTRSFVEEARRGKLDALRKKGILPFAYSFRRTHSAADALAAFQPDIEPHVVVAGRIVSLRRHGKATFAHLQDYSGNIQLYFKSDKLGEETYDLVKLLDLGDHIGATGTLFQTKTGETSVAVKELSLLAKALRPLPLGKQDVEGEQHGVLSDPETRFRRRYADLAVHSEVRSLFKLRARAISFIRRFLDERGFLEVETPVLQPLYGGAMARPFTTHHNALDSQLYLRIAAELYLKRCIVGGLERVYEIGKNFRNEGIDRRHNPEFTMLEFYQAYADYKEILTLTEELLHGLVTHVCGSAAIERSGTTYDFSPPLRQESYSDLVRKHVRIEQRSADDDQLRAALESRTGEDWSDMPRTRLLDAVFKTFVEPELQQPTVVLDYPIELSPLAKPKREDATLAERFEIYVAGTEVANAFSELNDPNDQRRRFEAQAAARAAGDKEAQQRDEDYIRALEYGMPPTGGCGLGIDRLLMVLAGQESVRDMILFPLLRPEDD